MDLNREEIEELKQYYYTDKNESVSYGELANIELLVTDDEIYQEYEGYMFSNEDFFVIYIDKIYLV